MFECECAALIYSTKCVFLDMCLNVMCIPSTYLYFHLMK